MFGAFTIVGMYLFMCEPHGEKDHQCEPSDARQRKQGAALGAATLVALSVFQIRWSWEVRMYTLGTALAVFSSWAMFRALNATVHRLRAWSLYGLTLLLFAYTHYYAMFSITAQGLFVLGNHLVMARVSPSVLRARSLWYPAVAYTILLVGYSPWLPVLNSQRHQVQTEFWSQPVRGWDVANVCYQMLIEPANATYSFAMPLVISSLCVTLILALLWKARLIDWYLVTATVIPFALSAFVSAVDTKIFHLRYFLFANLFLLASLSSLLSRLHHATERRLLYAWICAAAAWICIAFRIGLDASNRPGARACVAILAQHRKLGEPVVVCSSLLYFSVMYHAEDRRMWYLYNDGQDVVHYEGGAIIRPEDLIFDKDLRAISAPRVWVIDMTGWGRREVPIPTEWSLRQEHSFPEVYKVQGDILLREYTTTRRAPRPSEDKIPKATTDK
jgi:hypothetical protein